MENDLTLLDTASFLQLHMQGHSSDEVSALFGVSEPVVKELVDLFSQMSLGAADALELYSQCGIIASGLLRFSLSNNKFITDAFEVSSTSDVCGSTPPASGTFAILTFAHGRRF